MCQIRVFNCVTGITFDLNDNEDRTNYILNRLFEIAGDVNGFLLYPSMQIFTGEGKLLFSAKGESQLTEFIPVGNADFWTGTARKKLRQMWKDVCVLSRCLKRSIFLIWNICVAKYWKAKPV